MTKFGLRAKGTLSNVTNLRPSNDKEFNFLLQVKCTNCQEYHPTLVGLNKTDTYELSGSRGEASFVYKCTFCKRESSLNCESVNVQGRLSEDDKDSILLQLDCRGAEPIAFSPQGTWQATGSESNTEFSFEFDIEEERVADGKPKQYISEWMDYDEKTKDEVKIESFVTEWVRI